MCVRLLAGACAYVSVFRMSADIIDWTPGLQSVGSLQRAAVCSCGREVANRKQPA